MRPLEVGFTVEDLSYKLGGLIPVTVDLLARRDVSIRAGWVDLLCHERWTSNFVVNAPTSSRPVIVGGGGLPATVLPTPMAPRRVTEELKQTYVHSRLVFLEGLHLPSGATTTYNARLEVVQEQPDHVAVSTVTWKLALSIDLPHALDVHRNRPLDVQLD